ncbi:NAD(P)H-dependent oxidoreductase [Paracoccus sp. 11-3]|uniref:NAD(P)H-dependent oxidoreductase n=1 Tax=Paracoccus amoyensis TaxID=2760093 RepID=A0A926JBW7_9RHOB|nr:NAD(P)H-dependent oxidoreductase [Paracoccus amoyensis]MBC9247556.1 NAD(P)H-dependent oxidoreductase [Paracoccus amoyensis]
MNAMKNSDAYTLVNVFTPKAGETDRFLEQQLKDTADMRATAAETGWLNNEIYRARDGKNVIVVTRFASAEAQAAWAETQAFAEHLERIGPLLEHVSSTPVREIARHDEGQASGAALRLAVITGSTREGRFGHLPAEWIAAKAATRAFDVTRIDLRDYPMPFFGDPEATEAQKAAAEAFAKRIAEFDAYVFTVAEYNHAPTAVLKNALDHAEWARKPTGLVGYGGVGGARAVEHVRGIAAELQLVTMQTAVHVPFGDYLAISKGDAQFGQLKHLEDAAQKMLEQLEWWARALQAARSNVRLSVAV